jgi:hypothetical protein
MFHMTNAKIGVKSVVDKEAWSRSIEAMNY